MKLSNYSTLYFSVVLVFILSIWSCLFYINMIDEVYDSLDDGLENSKLHILERIKSNPALLNHAQFQDKNYLVTPISKQDTGPDIYRDTLLFTSNEQDYEPYRVLNSSFIHQKQPYKLTIITSMVEEDDLIEDLFFAVIWLYIGLLLCLIILNKWILKKAWKPFYHALDKLTLFRIEKGDDFKAETTRIVEFNILNKQLESLLNRTNQAYLDQKQFIENASHELQTPLAITLNKLELLLKKDLNEDAYALIDGAMQNLQRMNRLNSSLLLLSKIENQQFQSEVKTDLLPLLQETAEALQDLADYKEVKIQMLQPEKSLQTIHPDLVEILFTNLLKNAIIHNHKGGQVFISLNSKHFYIENTGVETALDPKKLFQRFYKNGNTGTSTGLGLAIAKTIALNNGFKLEYKYIGSTHRFSIFFR